MGTRRVKSPYGDFTLFFSKESPFSNFHPCLFFAICGDQKKKFTCVEQFYMFHKANTFNDGKSAEKILSTKDPKEMKRVGKEISGFSDEMWDKFKRDVMKNGLRAKFEQNNELRYCLFATHGSRLVECSPMDKIWGIGLSVDSKEAENPMFWRGANLLGVVLDEVREELWEAPKFTADREQIEKEIKIDKDYCVQYFAKKYGMVVNKRRSSFLNNAIPISIRIDLTRRSNSLHRKSPDRYRGSLNTPPYKLRRDDRKTRSSTSTSMSPRRNRDRTRSSTPKRRRVSRTRRKSGHVRRRHRSSEAGKSSGSRRRSSSSSDSATPRSRSSSNDRSQSPRRRRRRNSDDRRRRKRSSTPTCRGRGSPKFWPAKRVISKSTDRQSRKSRSSSEVAIDDIIRSAEEDSQDSPPPPSEISASTERPSTGERKRDHTSIEKEERELQGLKSKSKEPPEKKTKRKEMQIYKPPRSRR